MNTPRMVDWRVWHAFVGQGPDKSCCRRCGKPPELHRGPDTRKRKGDRHKGGDKRVRHAFEGYEGDGSPCERCGKEARLHRAPSARPKKATKPKRPKRWIVGIDGEGLDTKDGRHLYTYLAAVREDGKLVGEARNPKGLSSYECLRFFCKLPRSDLRVAFMFSYDVTKIVADLSPDQIYCLLRPDTRAQKKCPADHYWTGRRPLCPECGVPPKREWRSYQRFRTPGVPHTLGFDYFNGSLSAAWRNREKRRWEQSTKVWDVFRFFGCSFVEALTDWEIGTAEQCARILKMKKRRGHFAQEKAADVERYCREECELLAKMMRAVKTAHEEAGIALERYEGAGSSATVLLKKHKIARYRGPPLDDLPAELACAVACAFFGGRAECSTLGIVRRPYRSRDISSAYPYAMARLPCLKCGRWRRLRRDSGRGAAARLAKRCARADLALCQFRVRSRTEKERARIAWMPLPFRDDRGSTCYPTGFTGWGWYQEVGPALEGWPGDVELLGAWVYETPCAHEPFAWVPDVYRKRTEWKKDGKGKSLKLALNAGYGKLAQAVGSNPRFRSPIWAGVITASTRGQALRAIVRSRSRWSVLTIATDGITTLENSGLDAPEDLGTNDLTKPLGGWEDKPFSEGLFIAKPGFYFRLRAGIEDVRARGIGRREVYEQRRKLLQGWRDPVKRAKGIALSSRRFWGAKHSIRVRSLCAECGVSWEGLLSDGCPECGGIGDSLKLTHVRDGTGREVYGLWSKRRVVVSFSPLPKREAFMRMPGSRLGVRLRVRDMRGASSAPYEKGMISPEGASARAAKEFQLEQPDWDEGKLDEPEL